jgi:hypothetical protein
LVAQEHLGKVLQGATLLMQLPVMVAAAVAVLVLLVLLVQVRLLGMEETVLHLQFLAHQ